MNLETKILVTGYKGQLGYDVVKELTNRGFKNVLGIDREELDITDEVAVSNFINNYNKKLDIVIMDPPRKGSDEAFLKEHGASIFAHDMEECLKYLS